MFYVFEAILSGFSNQLRRDGVTSPGVIGMHEFDRGRNNETNTDDGSAVIMQRDEKYCATLNRQLGCEAARGCGNRTSPCATSDKQRRHGGAGRRPDRPLHREAPDRS